LPDLFYCCKGKYTKELAANEQRCYIFIMDNRIFNTIALPTTGITGARTIAATAGMGREWAVRGERM
jgi:hypothetical protein